MVLNPREKLEPLSKDLAALVDAKDVTEAVSRFEQLVATYRLAKMDWSYTLEQTTALLVPLGPAAVEPLLGRIEATQGVVRDATGPRVPDQPEARRQRLGERPLRDRRAAHRARAHRRARRPTSASTSTFAPRPRGFSRFLPRKAANSRTSSRASSVA